MDKLINSIYLCEADKITGRYVFNCKKYATFEEADSKHNSKSQPSTMLKISMFVPSFLHHWVLKYRLSVLFVHVNIKK